MRLVEEEDELRLVGVADFGKRLEHLRQQPEQEGRIELRARHQFVGGEDVDIDAAILVGADHVLNVERRSEEHTSELKSLMRISYAVFCLQKTKAKRTTKKYTSLLTHHHG